MIFFINFVLCISSLLIDNNTLILDSYILYLIQFIFNFLFLLSKTKYLNDFLMPSYIFIIYIGISQILGGFLAPRGFGWEKGFYNSLSVVSNMNVIVFFNLLVNFILTILTLNFITKKEYNINFEIRVSNKKPFFLILLIFIFFIITILQKYWLFPLQLALVIVILYELSGFNRFVKLLSISFLLIMMLMMNFESKREIIMAFIAVIFYIFYRNKTKFNISSIFLIPVIFFGFIIFVLTASIMRGYGDLDDRTFINSFIYLPVYLSSENFLDSVVDNFELNYSYSVPIIAMEYVLQGKIEFQYGMSLLKILFLVFPRSIFDMKPESMMLMFTRVYDYDFYSRGGSLPIILSSELFMNFYIFAIPVFFLIMWYMNKVYIKIFFTGSLMTFFICIHVIITFFMFMRGSGFDLFIFNILMAVAFYVFVAKILYKVRFK
jgi:hypothetical protein